MGTGTIGPNQPSHRHEPRSEHERGWWRRRPLSPQCWQPSFENTCTVVPGKGRPSQGLHCRGGAMWQEVTVTRKQKGVPLLGHVIKKQVPSTFVSLVQATSRLRGPGHGQLQTAGAQVCELP